MTIAMMAEAQDAFLATVIRVGDHVWPFDGTVETQDEILNRIRFHGIAALIAERVSGDASWPDEIRELVYEEARLQAFWEVSHRDVLIQLYSLLGTKGVEALVMKGTALAYSLYHNPAARRRGDTDLLVRESQLVETRIALQSAGLVRRQDPHGLFFQETWLFDTGIGIIHPIDLHWQPNDSPALQQVLRIDEFFADAKALPALASHASSPDGVITFVQGAINQAWHGAHGYLVDGNRVAGRGRLIWAWDNHLLARSFAETDWCRLLRIGLDRGIAPFVLNALTLSQRRCDTPISPDVIQELSAAPQETFMVRRILDDNQISASLIDLRALGSVKDKARFLLGHALPDGEHLRSKYPKSAGWPLSILRIRRLIEIFKRWLRARGD